MKGLLPAGFARFATALKLTLLDGGPGQCVFPINNACNAACDFCSFNRDALRREAWRFAPREGARDAARILYRHGVHYLIVTGGEPMMHEDFFGIVQDAKETGMKVLVVTNGSLLTPDSCARMAESGVSSVFISIDSQDPDAHESNRGLPKVLERVRRANAEFRRLGVQSTASVTMSRLVADYERLAAFLAQLGFSSVTFSYPLLKLASSFLGARESSLVDLSPLELDSAFASVQRLRRGFNVVNPETSIEDMRRFLKGERQLFECLGGWKYFYLDWELQLWRCHHWEEPLCSIYDFDDSKRVRDGCQRCMIDCMRDPSVLQHVSVSMGDALRQAGRGRLGEAAGTLLDRRNAVSVGEAFKQWRWISRL